MFGAGIPPIQAFPGADGGGGYVVGVVGVVILACAVLVTYLAARKRAGVLTSEEEPSRVGMVHRDRALVP
jgi:hypothetical protein